MKKDVLIKMICLSVALVAVSVGTLFFSNFKTENSDDFVSKISNISSAPNAENKVEQESSNGNPLNDAKKINETTALQIAAKYINTENAQIEKSKKEKIDTFVVANEFGTASISEKGGSLVSFSKNEDDEIKNFSDQQCIDKAEEFVLSYYSASFTPRYFESGEEDCFVVFTSKNGGTLCNPDKIEITVSKKSGEILSFDASDFLLNYRNRTLQAPEHTKEEAYGCLENNLFVEQVNQVIIETQSGEEMCYEFLCKTEDEKRVIVYINAYNLQKEEEILLPENKNGIFLK